jgi:hypothetical protein
MGFFVILNGSCATIVPGNGVRFVMDTPVFTSAANRLLISEIFVGLWPSYLNCGQEDSL